MRAQITLSNYGVNVVLPEVAWRFGFLRKGFIETQQRVGLSFRHLLTALGFVGGDSAQAHLEPALLHMRAV